MGRDARANVSTVIEALKIANHSIAIADRTTTEFATVIDLIERLANAASRGETLPAVELEAASNLHLVRQSLQDRQAVLSGLRERLQVTSRRNSI
jgi:hypothetical protein